MDKGTPPIIARNLLFMAAFAVIFAFALCASLAPHGRALAVTAAEKQAEADEVWAQIDSLQTSLNEAMDEYNAASEAYEQAVELRDEAAAQIEDKTERIETLQAQLSDFAVAMYKRGGNGSFVDVILQASTFDEFITSWEACSQISTRGAQLIAETREAREVLEKAKATYEEQSERAEKEMASADEKREQIEATQAELAEQAAKLDQEAAELLAKEELEAEAARQAEAARAAREEAIATGTAGASVLMGNGYFTNPCPDAYNSSGFGYRTFDNSFHMGLDMAAPEGTPYYAADSGTVLYATYDGGWNGGAGNWIVIAHGNGIVTKYMHSSAVFVSVGQYVERGQNIGLVGQTGEAYGAHLHFQVEVDGVAVNPLNYI